MSTNVNKKFLFGFLLNTLIEECHVQHKIKCLLLCNAQTESSDNQLEGYNCIIKYSGDLGQCKNLSECQQAQLVINDFNVQPTFCSQPSNNDPLDPLVCCDISSDWKRISERKCDEFYKTKHKRDTFIADSKPTPELIGGYPTYQGEFPFMVALGWKMPSSSDYDFRCGGFLIAPNYIVTAAHCASSKGIAPSVILPGGFSLIENKQLTNITEITIHPAYTKKYAYNDIAIMKLSEDVLFTPACLWPLSAVNYEESIALGYGKQKSNYKICNELLKVNLSLYDNILCSFYYRPGEIRKVQMGVLKSQICAGDPEERKDTCAGDSGGPLLVEVTKQSKKIPYVIGITSFGGTCGGAIPGIYTRISYYLSWIENLIWPEYGVR